MLTFFSQQGICRIDTLEYGARSGGITEDDILKRDIARQLLRSIVRG